MILCCTSLTMKTNCLLMLANYRTPYLCSFTMCVGSILIFLWYIIRISFGRTLHFQKFYVPLYTSFLNSALFSDRHCSIRYLSIYILFVVNLLFTRVHTSITCCPGMDRWLVERIPLGSVKHLKSYYSLLRLLCLGRYSLFVQSKLV